MKKIYLLLILITFCALGFLAYHNVDNSISKTDLVYINKILEESKITADRLTDFNDEVDFIKSVQSGVLKIAPVNKGIAEGSPREPEDLYQARYGLCYDRSRVIEKVLRAHNFKTRHISVFATKGNTSALKALITPGNESHAILEVETTKGWMFIDSNDKFIGLTSDMQPVSIVTLLENGYNNIKWDSYNNLNYKVIYQSDFTYLYGLYSRHGMFYEPYNKIPDINWPEFYYNIID